MSEKKHERPIESSPPKIPFRNYLALLLGTIFFFGEGLNNSILGPFFPNEAFDHHRVSTTWIGIIIAAYDVASLLGVFILAPFIVLKTEKFFFCLGGFLFSSSNAVFGTFCYLNGTLLFIWLCILSRLTMGFGASAVWCSGYSLLLPLVPKWSTKIISIFNFVIGIGIITGPAAGSVLYSIGGYPLPFLVSGSTEIVISAISFFILSDTNDVSVNKKAFDVKRYENWEEQEFLIRRESEQEPGKTIGTTDGNCGGFFHFISRPFLLLATLSHFVQSGSIAYIDVAVGPYLQQYFDVTGDSSGYYFLSFSLAFVLGTPCIGVLIQRGHGTRTFMAFSFLSGAAFWALAMAGCFPQVESPFWFLFWMAVEGVSCSACYSTNQLVYEAIAYKMGYTNLNLIRIVTASTVCVVFYFGRISS